MFTERLHYLDRKIAPGLSKLTWNAKGQLDVFLKDTRRHCADASKLVGAFHNNKALNIGESAETTHNELNFGVGVSFVTPRHVAYF